MSEYCEYMWDPTRGQASSQLARSIYEQDGKIDIRDKSLAIKTVRAILRGMPGVDLRHCTDEYITRFLLARKYRTEQTAALIAAYQAQVANRQDIFGNLTARDPAIQRSLRAGIPGVLPARDKKGRCILIILASQWDPIAVPALALQRAIFLVLEILIQDPRNQQCGFVAVIDWSEFGIRQAGALGAAAIRNLIAALRGRFPARFKAIHFLSPPLYVQATLALIKPFLDDKTRHKIYLHGNNLSTLHQHLPTDILPAELGGTGPPFNAGMWAEPVINSAMKEAEMASRNQKKLMDDQNGEAEEENAKTENKLLFNQRPDNSAGILNKTEHINGEKTDLRTNNESNNSKIYESENSAGANLREKMHTNMVKSDEFELDLKLKSRQVEADLKSDNIRLEKNSDSLNIDGYEKKLEDQLDLDVSNELVDKSLNKQINHFKNENIDEEIANKNRSDKENNSNKHTFASEDDSEISGFLENSNNSLESFSNSLNSEKHTESTNLIT